jgi:hypothetical protein
MKGEIERLKEIYSFKRIFLSNGRMMSSALVKQLQSTSSASRMNPRAHSTVTSPRNKIVAATFDAHIR